MKAEIAELRIELFSDVEIVDELDTILHRKLKFMAEFGNMPMMQQARKPPKKDAEEAAHGDE